ncbi:branched-chain amino acid ABC transporter permease [Variovorax paradoxus]|uniref:branched-chain amino acid ABC transporter permease n=1 Tax=Variovorax paradoxus TaxID=34073 RepID=UPI001D17A2CD|nr:branched-chain amino acid ABC transporter permease [Variovorax paradoxus]
MTGRGTLPLRAGALVALAAIPLAAMAMGESFYLAFGARVLIYAIAAVGLNIALGFGGMVSLGHALFLGLGMYSVALPAHFGIDSGWIHLALTVASCALAGTLTGWISLRTAGIAFIMITLAFAQMGFFVLVSLKQFGGDDGLAVAAPSNFGRFGLDSPLAVYIAAFAMLLGLLIWTDRLRQSSFGMALRACRQSGRRAASLGIMPRRCLLAAYVLSAVICGIAGLLLANLNAYVSPSTMSWFVSGELIVMVVLGGIGSAFGPAVGALVYLGAEEVLKSMTGHWMAVFGLLIFAMALVGRPAAARLAVDWSRRPRAVGANRRVLSGTTGTAGTERK